MRGCSVESIICFLLIGIYVSRSVAFALPVLAIHSFFVVAKIMHFAAIGVSFSYGRDLRPCLLSRAYVVGEFLFYFFLLGLKGPFLFCFSF